MTARNLSSLLRFRRFAQHANTPGLTGKRMARGMQIMVMLICSSMLSACGLWGKLVNSDAGHKPTPLAAAPTNFAGKTAWSAQIGEGTAVDGDAVGLVPRVVSSAVYAAAVDGSVGKWRLTDGQALWRVQLGQTLAAGVGSDGSTTVVTTRQGEVIALDDSGAIKWRLRLTGGLTTPPVVYQSHVFLRTADHQLFALDAQTGERRWLFSGNAPTLSLSAPSGMAVIDQTVIAGFPGGRLLAFDVKTGSLKWEVVVALPKGSTELERVVDVVGVPLIVDNDVCAVTYQGRIACFDVTNGAQRWSQPFSSSSGVGGDPRWIFATDERSRVFAFDRSTGVQKWRQEKFMWRMLTAPVSVGRSVVAGDLEGQVHWLSREDGSVLGRLATDGSPILVPAQGFEQGIVIQTRSGKLFALRHE